MTRAEPWVVAAFAANTKSIDYVRDLGWSGSKTAAFSYHGPSDVRVTYGYDNSAANRGVEDDDRRKL